MKGHNCQPRLLYPAKLSFKIQGKIKTFHDKHKLKELITIKPSLKKMLKSILQTEKEAKFNHENARKKKSHQKRR
jgi:hypothetical protein